MFKAYVVSQLVEIIVPKEPKQTEATSTKVKGRRFFLPEDISSDNTYHSDIRYVTSFKYLYGITNQTFYLGCLYCRLFHLQTYYPRLEVPYKFYWVQMLGVLQ